MVGWFTTRRPARRARARGRAETVEATALEAGSTSGPRPATSHEMATRPQTARSEVEEAPAQQEAEPPDPGPPPRWSLDVWRIARERWPVAAICTVALSIAPLALVLTADATYRSEALVAVAPPQPVEPDYAYVPAFETNRTVRDVLVSDGAAVATSDALGGEPTPDEVQARVAVTSEPDGWQTITVRADGPSAEEARLLAATLVRTGLPSARSAVRTRSRVVLAVPASEGQPVPDSPWVNVAAVLGLSLLAGFLVAVLVDLVARTRRRTR